MYKDVGKILTQLRIPADVSFRLAGNGDHKPSEPLPLPSDETSSPPSPSSSTDAALDRLNTRLTTIHASLPAHSALIILTGHSSPLPMLEMTAKRQKWERLVKTLGGTEGVPKEERWLSEDDRKLEEAVYVAREGMSFFCVKGRDTAATTD